jgi:hypothetical protein
MNWIRPVLLIAVTIGSLAGCVAPTPDNPYPGSGGSLLRDQTPDEVADARRAFDPDKLAAFRIGTSTKREVVAALGEPAWWSTSESGYSRLGYNFHSRGATVNAPGTVPVTFVFDGKNTLVDADYADSKIHVERGPFTNAYVEGRVAEKYLMLDGIVPADWCRDIPPGGDCVYLGGYIRTPVHVRRVVAGEIPRRDLVLQFTIATPRIGPWTGYFLLSTDRFGTTRVLTWGMGPYLCQLKDDATREPEIAAVIRAVKSSPTCTSEMPVH